MTVAPLQGRGRQMRFGWWSTNESGEFVTLTKSAAPTSCVARRDALVCAERLAGAVRTPERGQTGCN